MIRKVYTNTADFIEQNNTLSIPLPYSEDISILSEPINIKNKTIKNRMVCQAMEGCDSTKDGRPGELTVRRYNRLAAGGAGLIWVEATSVMENARANPNQLMINEKNLDSFKKLAEDIKNVALRENGYEPVVILQLTHSGRYSKPNGFPESIIAYNNPILEGDNPISSDKIITDDESDRVREAHISAALLAQKAGFDGADIKCSHGYLLSELLSAYNREGRYGGSLKNRSRLLIESVEGAIQSCDSDFIITSRMNVYDGIPYPYGFGSDVKDRISIDLSEATLIIENLKNLGVELIDITMGNPYFIPHINRPYAKGTYEASEHPLIGVARMLHGTAEIQKAIPEIKMVSSGMTYLGTVSPNVAAGFIKENGFSMAGYGRMILANPDFAKDILNGGLDAKKICTTCSKCTQIMRGGGTPGCVIRDTQVYLPIYKKYCK